MTNTLTISNSGTAWIRDELAQGKDPIGGWKNSPKAAYYASLDELPPGDIPSPTGSASAASPASFADIMKLQADASSGKKPA